MSDAQPVNYWGSFVFSYRRLHALTQEHLANKLNVSQQTVSRWEAGQQVPDPHSQATLRAVLGEADLGSKKIWTERVRRSSGIEALLDSSLVFLSVSAGLAAGVDMTEESMIGRPYAKFLPAGRPMLVEKAVREGFFEGAHARLHYVAEINYGPLVYNVAADIWPVATSDAGILMHVVYTPISGPQTPGHEGLRISGFQAEPNTFVGGLP